MNFILNEESAMVKILFLGFITLFKILNFLMFDMKHEID